ncbi:uncharacterized protein DUF4054 [Bosea sp. AK1]|uniref:DUF4054 domain-containing protein n=1 Tax=Bosea sp. AK1 TaxID=2587160 RepID=UPI0011517129|nr:DUF4054 domain-containing protein [Bosea sp. AK1]TQI72913.1 uncharacterized protein DUF4054 [Bosea sp. AK1]
MPYTLPTAADFRAKFPAFAAVGDPTVTLAIQEASSSVDESWIEADYQPAILYLAAHILVVDGAITDGLGLGAVGGAIAAGVLSEAKVGDVTAKLASGGNSGGSSASGYGSTAFGSRYLQLLRRNQPAVALV